MIPDAAWFNRIAAERYAENYLPDQKIMIHVTQKRYADVCQGFAPDMRRALDVGCSWGWLPRELRLENIEAYGIDISPQLIDQVTDWWREFLEVGNIVDLPYEDNSFDFVNARDVIEHVPPKYTRRAVRELYRVSSRYVLIVEPTLKAAREDKEFEHRAQGAIFGHYVMYEPDTWAEIFGELDWRRVDIPVDSPIRDERGLKMYFLYEKGAA